MSSSSIHWGISCDLCWVCPIVGNRYKSNQFYDFDLCRSCLEENDDYQVSDFVVFENKVTSYTAASVGPAPGSMLRATSPREAAANVYRAKHRYGVTAVFTFNYPYSWEDCKGYEELSSALANDTSIMTLRIHLCGSTLHEGGLARIAQGIACNKTIRRVTFHLSDTAQKSISENDRKALYNMVTENTTVKGLYILGNCDCNLDHLHEQDLNLDGAEYDLLAQSIASALRYNTTIKQVRLESSDLLSCKSKALFIEAAQKKKSLLRVYADFCENDDHLELLLENNRNCWSQRFCDIRASPEDHLRVLLEAKSLSMMDPVHSLFFLIRNCPTMVLEAENRQAKCSESDKRKSKRYRGGRRFLRKILRFGKGN